MLNLYSLNEQELLDLKHSKQWMWELLQNPRAQQEYESALDSERFMYIQHEYKDEYNLHTWSCIDIRPTQLLDPHPWPNAKYIEHENSETGCRSSVTIKGPLWIDLWVAASHAIDISHTHHSFIEGFTSFNSLGEIIEVWTGS